MTELNNQTAPKTLPDSWQFVPLGSVVKEAQSGFAIGERDSSGVIQLRMNNVDTRGNLIWNEFIRVPANAETISRFQLQSGDVVFNNTNSTELVGKSAFFEGHEEPVVYSNHFTRLKAESSQLEPRYLAFWLLNQWQLRIFENLCNRWIGQSAVKADKLLALHLPLPPLPEQKRIAAILTEQVAAIERARSATVAQIQATKGLHTAYLREVFQSLEATQWPEKQLADLCEIQLGKMLSPKSKTGISSFPYLRNANVQWGRLSLDDMAEMDFSELERKKFALKRGDLLVCEGGEPGRAAIWDGQIEPCYYQKALHRLRPISSNIMPEFLMYRLWFAASKHEFSDSHAKTTIAHLPAVRLAQLTVRVPPIAEQTKLVASLNQKFKAADSLRGLLAQQSNLITNLPSTLLKRGFNGEL